MGDSGGAVRLGMFFTSNEFGIMAKFSLEVGLWLFWDFENIFLSTTNDFERNYLMSLRNPPSICAGESI